MFKVGQKVVCVDGSFPSNLPDILPKEGTIYTIRSNYKGIRLNEIVNNPRRGREGFAEVTFAYRRFDIVDETFAEETIAMLNEHFETLKELV